MTKPRPSVHHAVAAHNSRAIALALMFACIPAIGGCDGGGADDDSTGAVCAVDDDCDGLLCRADLEAPPEDLAPYPLVCGKATEGAAPGAACEQANDCALGVCLLAGACARPCTQDGECKPHERCQAVFARSAVDALQPLSACVAETNLPEDANVDVQPRPRALSAGDNEIELDAAEDHGETLYVLQAERDLWPDGVRCRSGLCVRALRTRDAKARILFDADADYMQESPQNPIAIGDHIDPPVIMLPAGARDALSDAGYVATLSAEQAGKVAGAGNLRVTRLSRSGSGKRLDLNVFYVGALDWEPEGERGPQLLSEALGVVDEILDQADISIGDVRQISVPGELPLRGTAFPKGDAAQGFAVLQVRFGVYAELPGLFRLSAGAGNSALNLFFVQDIEPLSGDGEPEAEAGGIPGPLGMQGTSGSGIAIATDMMAGDAMRLGRTLAHEIGHYLGLFHTSEGDGSVFEALADTPECRNDRDADRDGLSVDDCQDAGADNLMFWARTTGSVLTKDQQAILRSALILR